MKRLKCEKCGKTLLLIEYGKLAIKCPRCGLESKVEIKEVNEQAVTKIGKPTALHTERGKRNGYDSRRSSIRLKTK